MDYEPNFDKTQRRNTERRRAELRRRRVITRYITLALVSLTVLMVAGVLIWRAADRNSKPQLSQPTQPTTTQTAPTTQTVPPTQKPEPTQPTQPQRPTDEITLVFGGDLVANDRVVAAGKQDSQ